MSYFSEHAPEVTPRWPTEASGLRVAQLGAAWAAASYFTLDKGPAQIVLPTGVGKTAVMTLLPYLVPTGRLLVVTPSRVVRDQAAAEFKSLSRLRAVGAVPSALVPPKVFVAEHRMADWNSVVESDVVVGTPSVLSPAHEGVAAPPVGLFDLVLIDEAHHAAAPTWSRILTDFEGTRAALLTATPFRLDQRGLPGEISTTIRFARR